MILLLTINGNDKIGVNVIMSTIIYEGKELKVFSTARYKGKTYYILEEARDTVDSSGFYFYAWALDENGTKYMVRWDADNDEADELADCVSDWDVLSDVTEFDWDDIYELDGKPIEKMILNK